MYLSKVELNGFKSFYTKTTIELDGGITNIVGPNGCGKSNILDAVRWVLGEQSPKQLRGEQISDVISTGNARRAAKNTAVAFLTFSDCEELLDQEEVEVGRAVDQDGKGTYYLDGEKVRLRDIQDLFRDTGVGQELYSVIGQGEVQELVQSKPEERREIVEEAAGVATYRHRRDLTEKRLERTREDLVGVQEDLRKKQGRLSQLENQAEKADQAREIQAELRNYKLEQARRKYIQYRDKLADLKEEISALEAKYKTVQEQRDSAKEKKQDFQGELSWLEQKFTRLEKQVADSREARQQAQQERASFRMLTEELEEQIESDQTRKENYLSQLDSGLQELVEEYQQLYHSRLQQQIYQQEIELLTAREDELRARRDRLDRRLDDFRSDTLFQVSEESEYQHWVKTLEENQGNLEARREELEAELNSLQSELHSDLEELRSSLNRYSSVETEKAELRRKLDVISEEMQVLERLKSKFVQGLEKLQRRKERHRSQHRTLRDLRENYKGYYDGVQEILNSVETGAETGVFGAVAEAIEVRPQFQSALRSALGKFKQAVIVRDFSIVEKLLEQFGNEELGRINFLSLQQLNSFEFETTAAEVSEYGDVLGRTLEYVEYPEKLAPAIEFLLKDVFVVENFSSALDTSRKLDGELDFELVTKNGELITAAGLVSAGDSDNNRVDLVGRSEKINNLKQQQEELSEQIETYEDRVNSISQIIEDLEARENRVASALRGIEGEAREAYEELSRCRHRVRNAQDNYREHLGELAAVEAEELTNYYSRLAADEISSTIAGRDRRRRQRRKKYKDELKEAEEALNRCQRDWRCLEKQSQEANSETERSLERIDQLEKRRRELQQEIIQINSQARKRRSRWLNKEASRSRRKLDENRLEVEIETWQELKRAHGRLRNNQQQELEKINQQLQEKEKQTGKTESKLDNYRHRRENLRQRLEEQQTELREEFELDPDQTELGELELEAEQLETEELEQKIRRLKGELRELQPVNMLAEKEAKEVREEVESTREQKEDLENSSERLEQIIEQLDKKAREQFQESFQEIRDYFSDFVTELFGGGKGRLELTDDPVLDAGVEIEVEPPGENIKNMSALSGGEKTLVAVAFLFALFEYHPTPFCFLDEVDAPFDDENVGQLINLIHRYSSDTQFVMITHNKITMQAASQLYGVTMEESGVSTVVGLELPEAENWREEAVG